MNQSSKIDLHQSSKIDLDQSSKIDLDQSSKIDLDQAIENYISSLDEMEQLTLEVAKRQLESSFEIHKSIGFLEYLKVNNIIIT